MAVSEHSGPDDDASRSIDRGSLGVAFAVGLVPAFGLYVVVSIAVPTDFPTAWVLLLGVVAFTWSFYSKPGVRGKVGAGLFWLAMEAFAAPIAMLAFSITYVSGEAGGFAQVGAAIGGAIIVVVTWFVAWLVGIILYLVSRRLERSAVTVEAGD